VAGHYIDAGRWNLVANWAIARRDNITFAAVSASQGNCDTSPTAGTRITAERDAALTAARLYDFAGQPNSVATNVLRYPFPGAPSRLADGRRRCAVRDVGLST
jgi:hypothetical protein